MIKKVLLINPRISISKGSIKRLPTPLGIMYVAANLEKHGYDVAILDSACEGYEHVVEEGDNEIYGLSDEDLIKRIKQEAPDFVGVTCNFSKQEEEVYRTCKIVKSILPDVLTATGGLHPTWLSKKMMEECPELDFIIHKEGELRTMKLLHSINWGASYEGLDGLSFRKDGKIITNPAIDYIGNLDQLPYPARHLINMGKYIQIGLFANPFPKRERVAQVLTSRGCNFNCDFCATKPFWGKFRRRSAENILGELKELKEKYNIQEIQFRDDNLFSDKENAIELLKGMKGIGFVWYTGLMLMHLDEPLIKLMAESGCYKFTVSIESASNRVLKELIHKYLDLSKVKPVIDWAHKYNMSVHTDNIIGYPGETKEEMLRTFEFNKEVGADSASFFMPSPYIGSPLYDRCKERGWLDEDSHKVDFKTPGIHIKKTDPEYVMSREDLVKFVEEKTREFNEWSKKRNPEKWEEKYKIYNKKHKDDVEIMGRVV